MKKEHICTVLIFSCRTEASKKSVNLLVLSGSLDCNGLSLLWSYGRGQTGILLKQSWWDRKQSPSTFLQEWAVISLMPL